MGERDRVRGLLIGATAGPLLLRAFFRSRALELTPLALLFLLLIIYAFGIK
jgi:hypothetical protein